MNLPDEQAIAALEGELRKLPLRGMETVEGYVLHRWPSMLPQFYTGYYRSLRRFLKRSNRSDRTFFAGDYLVAPYTEAALTSGLRAAQACAARLGAPS